MDRGKTCGNTVCFTSNLTVAQSFNTCVRAQEDVSQAKAKKDGNLAPNAKRSGGTGNCEYIDYDVLKKASRAVRLRNLYCLMVYLSFSAWES